MSDGDVQFYMDDWLDKRLSSSQKIVNTKDEDLVIAVDGPEGAGKSVFAFQLARKLDPSFDLSRVAMTSTAFRECVLFAKKGQAVVYDEAFTGLSSRGALSEANKLLVELMMEMRQKNLFVIVVMPSYFLLDRYVALWRARVLFHVYRNGGRRGYWICFDKREKKLLYLYGKKDYSYKNKHIPKVKRRGRFLNQYTIDEMEYRRLKAESFQSKERATRAEVLMDQRDRLFFLLWEHYKLSVRDISSLVKEYGVNLSPSSIGELLKKMSATIETDRKFAVDK